MNIESNLSGHWTDEQLIEHLYTGGPDGEHLDTCAECRDRLSSFIAARTFNDRESAAAADVSSDLLAAQRRAIYARIEREQGSRFTAGLRRWVAAGAMVVLLGGGTFLYEQRQRQAAVESRISDAQLAQEVSQLATDGESASTAPLQGLFDE